MIVLNKKMLLKSGVALIIAFCSTIPLAPKLFAANYWYSGSTSLQLINGVSDGLFINNAPASVTLSDGTTFNMQQTALGAMNAWNNATEAYFPTSNPGLRSNIQAYGANYGNNGLNGWAEMYKSSTDTSPMNPDKSAPTNHWAYAKVYGNAYHMWDGTTMTYDQRKAVYTHEIGHALGLAHASTGVASVMRDEAQRHANGWYTPQTDDINGVNNLYTY